MPVISIIVPVYKVEPYLRRCIDSILAQTFTDFECILIDDGSPDSCPEICDEYAKKDNRIVVIHQENKGVSAARNAGLDKAKGEWIGFVDSDDWCDEGMFQFLYENVVKYDADVSGCGFRNVLHNSSIRIKKEKKLIRNEVTVLTLMFAGKLISSSPWAKLIKTNIIINNNIRYDVTVRYGEDTLFLYELVKCTDKIFLSSMPYYNYFRRLDSATGIQALTDIRKTVFMAYDKMLYFEKNKELRKRIKSRKAREACGMAGYYLLTNNYSSKSYIYLRDIIKNNFLYVFSDFTISFKEKMWCLFALYPKVWHLVHTLAMAYKMIMMPLRPKLDPYISPFP